MARYFGDDVSVEVHGLEEIEANLEKLAGDARKRVVRKGLQAGGTVLKDALAENTPVQGGTGGGGFYPLAPLGHPGGALEPGEMKASVEMSLREGKVVVGFDRAIGNVPLWVEQGHAIVRGKRSTTRAGRAARKGQKVTGQAPPHPFIAPAFEISAEAAIDKCIETMKTELESEAPSSSSEGGAAPASGE